MARVIDKYGGIINNTGKNGGTVSNGTDSTSWENYMKAKAYGGGQREVNTMTGNVTSKDGKELYGNIYGGVSNPNYQNYGKTNNPVVPVSYGSGGDDGSSARLQALRDAIERNRQNAINSLNKSKEADLADWRNNWNQLRNNYQGLIDQSEIERFKTLRSQRENQANRGQLNSGYGRQTMLNTDTRYGNQLIGIKNQEQSDLSALKSTLANIMASYKQKETEINNNTDNSLLQLM